MVQNKKRKIALILAAIGVVFGDIGTSPLYALPAVFSVSHLSLSRTDIYGIISLIIWSVTLVVSVKYIAFIMRANNNGEGGIMALVALVQNANISKKQHAFLVLLGLAGVSLFFGDSIITPAISVLSAVEGVGVVAPGLKPYIIPMTLVILGLLFIIQVRGTAFIGKFFGPVMVTWFIVLGLGGLLQIFNHPDVLSALLPTTAFGFLIAHPLQSFAAMAAVILAITGAEALYADMGHFGRGPITRAWFYLVFPALALNYMGQGALIIAQPEAIHSSFFLLFPEMLRLPVVLLATGATFIASQAVISGAFSLTRQAVQLGFAPRLLITHTSKTEVGQVYIPALNWLICAAVAVLVVSFETSTNLAGAYGMAVSGTLVIDTILFLVVARFVWQRSRTFIVSAGLLFLGIDLIFLSSSLSKLLHGGWLPILIAVIAFTILSTWTKARLLINRERRHMEGTLESFVKRLRSTHPKIPRMPGYGVYLGQHAGYAPLALHATLDQLHELHEKVVIVNIETANIPHIPEESRIVFDGLGHEDDGISHVTIKFGFKDIPNVPRALETAREQSEEVNFDPYKASYFVSLTKPVAHRNKHIAHWRKLLYIALVRNATSPTDYYKLPLDHTVEMSSYVKL